MSLLLRWDDENEDWTYTSGSTSSSVPTNNFLKADMVELSLCDRLMAYEQARGNRKDKEEKKGLKKF